MITSNDLAKINDWVHQWKMSVNSDPSKEAQEVIFTRKVNKDSHSPLTFNNNQFIRLCHKNI